MPGYVFLICRRFQIRVRTGNRPYSRPEFRHQLPPHRLFPLYPPSFTHTAALLFSLADEQISDFIDINLVARMQERVRIHFLYHRRTTDLLATPQFVTVVHTGLYETICLGE